MKKKATEAQNEQKSERLEISLKIKRNGYLLEVGDLHQESNSFQFHIFLFDCYWLILVLYMA